MAKVHECIGICNRFKVKFKLHFNDPPNLGRCRECGIVFRDVSRCPCCGMALSTRPRKISESSKLLLVRID